MKEFFASRKSVIALSIATVLFIVPFALSEWTAKKINSVKMLGSGSTTCFTRVGQTFTALMIKDFSSDYLGKNFTAMTGECFGELNKNFESLYGSSFVAAKKPLNKLTSDLFWFHEKTAKLFKMSKEGAIDLTPSSNILNKFSSLESLNIEFQNQLDQKAAGLAVWRNVWIGLSMVGVFLLGAMALVLGRFRQKEKGHFATLDKEAKELLENQLESDMIHAKTSRLMEHVFKAAQTPHCFELFAKVQEGYLESKASRPFQDVERAPVLERHEESSAPKERANFNSITRALVDRLRDKAFTHGVILDESLEEDFWVEGNKESLEQLLYNLLSFGLENSLHHNSGRKISVRSKALGGIAYFKAKISNYLLNPDEMELFNGKAASSATNVNLLLLQEISADLGATVSAKNIINKDSSFTGAEIEIVFKRARDNQPAAAKKPSKLNKLIKGKKKDLRNILASEA